MVREVIHPCCGVVTPFNRMLVLLVYAYTAMGMPGSECDLEEVLCLILGPLIQESIGQADTYT